LRNYHGANKIDGYMRILGGSQHFLRSGFNGWNRHFDGYEDVVERYLIEVQMGKNFCQRQ